MLEFKLPLNPVFGDVIYDTVKISSFDTFSVYVFCEWCQYRLSDQGLVEFFVHSSFILSHDLLYVCWHTISTFLWA